MGKTQIFILTNLTGAAQNRPTTNNIMYYVISLCHTAKNDRYITLWRPNNAGYCYSKERAGVYESFKEGYHDNDDNIAIKAEDLDRFFIPLPYDGEIRLMIPNCRAIHEALNVRVHQGYLKRKRN